jgi:solute carrier family 13 (sodium-dependent dicarboxylate transporter), member 2/3/5
MVIHRRQILLIGISIAAGMAAYLLFPDLDEGMRRTLAIFVVATLLWVTEAIPLFTTSLVILFLQVVLLGLPGGPLALEEGGYRIFLNPFFDPVITLLVGGFALGLSLQRQGLDEVIAGLILRLLPPSPYWILGGLMAATAVMSMWMSNTATAALMLAVVFPILQELPEQDPFRKGLILGIPFAANLGGMATPIGTPPNAMALGALNRAGIPVGFLDWMLFALPLSIGLTAITWFLLIRMFPPTLKQLSIRRHAPLTFSAGRVTTVFVFFLTVSLWLTSGLHQLPEGIVGLLPVIIFFSLGILDQADVRRLGWDVLLVVGGGLSLGVAMSRSGLSQWMVAQVPITDLPPWMIFMTLTLLAAVMTSFISNSATTALLIPIVVGMSASVELLPAGAAIALGASASMALPISTPPNAIAYRSEQITARDMFRSGVIVTALAAIAIAILVLFL